MKMEMQDEKFEYVKGFSLQKAAKLYRASCLLNFYAAASATVLVFAALSCLTVMKLNNIYVAQFVMRCVIWFPLALLFKTCRNMIGRGILFLISVLGSIAVLYMFFFSLRQGWSDNISNLLFSAVMYIVFATSFWIALQKELFVRKIRLTHNEIKLVYKSLKQDVIFTAEDLYNARISKKYLTYSNIVFCTAILLSLLCIVLGLVRAM